MARQPSKILGSAKEKVKKQKQKDDIKVAKGVLSDMRAKYAADNRAYNTAKKALDKSTKVLENAEKRLQELQQQ